MPYTQNDWLERHRARSDITAFVTHLTRGAEGRTGIEVLAKILNERRLVGSGTGFIVGGARVVCFQDAPVYALAQNVRFEAERVKEQGDRVRYEGFGVGFPKTFVYQRGGRPVVYESSAAARAFLPSNQHWRIVGMEMANPANMVDWSHEREWRIQGDLTFDLDEIVVVVRGAGDLKELRRLVGSAALERVAAVTVLSHVLS